MSQHLRAITVCVDYADYLAITLAYNRHHFNEVMVVTVHRDVETWEVAKRFGASPFMTQAFYDEGEIFNKWKALEEAFDCYGRHGWICNMDADVLWPKTIPPLNLEFGNLYAPYRRMMADFTGDIPPENTWAKYRRHRNVAEWAGYSQIFHAEDSCLENPPWHEINWKHAGGADSFFQKKWPRHKKIRPDFEVLHLGSAGTNWCGRATPYLDGTVPKEREQRLQQLKQFMQTRRKTRKFDSEKCS